MRLTISSLKQLVREAIEEEEIAAAPVEVEGTPEASFDTSLVDLGAREPIEVWVAAWSKALELLNNYPAAQHVLRQYLETTRGPEEEEVEITADEELEETKKKDKDWR